MSYPDDKKTLKKAKDIVFNLLKYRVRSSFEIEEKLRKKKFSNNIIEEVIKYFTDLNLINDIEFAQRWADYRLRKPYGLNRIKFELEKKGIDKDIIDSILKETADNNDYNELDIAYNLAKQRIKKYNISDKNKIKQRIYGYLHRRGFSTNTIIKIIKSI